MGWYHGTRHHVDGDMILPGREAGKPSNYPYIRPDGLPTTEYAWAAQSIEGAAAFALTCKTDGPPVVYEVWPYGYVEPDPYVFGSIRVAGKLRIIRVVTAGLWERMVDAQDGAL